ncbi:WxL protein peptidoglycan domain-containing protein [Micromonospora sp. NPDC050417]|uniref:WxL protein peptidoglycan domain-containing protein n=1 Tax=Micromonospora sp. NPDC050417 TaxID=3364280 RepID=UPI00379E0AEA
MIPRSPLVLVAALIAITFASPGQAAPAAPTDDISWAVQPSGETGPTGRAYFAYDARPGQRIDDRVAVSNLGRTPLTLTVYGTDAFNTADGGFGLLSATQRPTDVGAWTSVTGREYALPAGERVIIPFHLDVPANATPGDHTGGLIASVAEVRTDTSGERVNLDRRAAARIYLRVAGPLHPSLQVETLRVTHHNPLNPFGGGTTTIRYQLRNTGNVRVGGTGSVSVTGPFGWSLAGTDPLVLPELLPGSMIEVRERVTGLPAAGRLEMAVHIAPSTMDVPLPQVTRTTGVWAPPWLLLAVLALGCAVALLRRLGRGRHRRTAAASASAATPIGAGTAGGQQ